MKHITYSNLQRIITTILNRISNLSYSITSTLNEVYDNLDNLDNNKVDKIPGKSLSTNDYSDEEKTKLSNLASKTFVTSVRGSNESTPRTGSVTISASDIGAIEGDFAYRNLIFCKDSVDVSSNNCLVMFGIDHSVSTSSDSEYTLVQGCSNIVGNGAYGIIVGDSCRTDGYGSAALGICCEAKSDGAIAVGFNSKANESQLAAGHFPDLSIATPGCSSGTDTSTLFLIGNGTSTTGSNAFRVTAQGAVYARSALRTTGADYAEYIEWADSNPDFEDRRGYFVTYDEINAEKMRIANSGEDIIGIISGNPAVIGNSDDGWYHAVKFDEYSSIKYTTGSAVKRTYDKNSKKMIDKEITIEQYDYAENYDPSREYISRQDRAEWDAVAFLGRVSVRDDGTCVPGGYCKCKDGGIATACNKDDNYCYKVLSRISDNIVRVHFK